MFWPRSYTRPLGKIQREFAPQPQPQDPEPAPAAPATSEPTKDPEPATDAPAAPATSEPTKDPDPATAAPATQPTHDIHTTPDPLDFDRQLANIPSDDDMEDATKPIQPPLESQEIQKLKKVKFSELVELGATLGLPRLRTKREMREAIMKARQEKSA